MRLRVDRRIARVSAAFIVVATVVASACALDDAGIGVEGGEAFEGGVDAVGVPSDGPTTVDRDVDVDAGGDRLDATTTFCQGYASSAPFDATIFCEDFDRDGGSETAFADAQLDGQPTAALRIVSSDASLPFALQATVPSPAVGIAYARYIKDFAFSSTPDRARAKVAFDVRPDSVLLEPSDAALPAILSLASVFIPANGVTALDFELRWNKGDPAPTAALVYFLAGALTPATASTVLPLGRWTHVVIDIEGDGTTMHASLSFDGVPVVVDAGHPLAHPSFADAGTWQLRVGLAAFAPQDAAAVTYDDIVFATDRR